MACLLPVLQALTGERAIGRERERSLLIDDAAAALGVSRRTVYYRIREGQLRTIRTPCGSQRVLLSSIDELRAKPRPRRKRPGVALAAALATSTTDALGALATVVSSGLATVSRRVAHATSSRLMTATAASTGASSGISASVPAFVGSADRRSRAVTVADGAD